MILNELLNSDELAEQNSLNEDQRITVNYSYTDNPDYDLIARMYRINFDEECEKDLKEGNAFIIGPPKTTIKRDLKDDNSIFSSKFGKGLGDLDPFIDRYSCQCGNLKSRINHGLECPVCHTICKYIDDNYKIFGYLQLVNEYPIIHPDLYVQIDSFLGKSKYDKKTKNKQKGSKLRNILDYDIALDVNGNPILDNSNEKPDEPFYGRGFLFFNEHFDEIMDYYIAKYPKKIEVYKDIMADREKVFIHHIPVFTTLLRPTNINDGSLYHEKCTALYNMMVKLTYRVNKNRTKIDKTTKLKSQEMFNLQMKLNELYSEIVKILSGKRGQLRSLIAGRYSFSSRCVIRQDPSLRIDQVKLPYKALVIMLKGQIENILHRMYNITYQVAHDIWYRAVAIVDQKIVNIIQMLIDNGEKDEEGNNLGLPVIINRNPSIDIIVAS